MNKIIQLFVKNIINRQYICTLSSSLSYQKKLNINSVKFYSNQSLKQTFKLLRFQSNDIQHTYIGLLCSFVAKRERDKNVLFAIIFSSLTNRLLI